MRQMTLVECPADLFTRRALISATDRTEIALRAIADRPSETPSGDHYGSATRNADAEAGGTSVPGSTYRGNGRETPDIERRRIRTATQPGVGNQSPKMLESPWGCRNPAQELMKSPWTPRKAMETDGGGQWQRIARKQSNIRQRPTPAVNGRS